MSKDNLDQLFDRLNNQWDTQNPTIGHQDRFLNKLNNQQQLAKTTKSYLKPLLAVAATIVLIVTISFALKTEQPVYDLASVSPEMAETQHFFTSTIAFELNKLKNVQTEDTKAIIKDAMFRLEELEKEYEQLKISLNESGEDQLVIFAMITNFQNRIDILKTTLQYIEDQKELKQNNYETTI